MKYYFVRVRSAFKNLLDIIFCCILDPVATAITFKTGLRGISLEIRINKYYVTTAFYELNFLGQVSYHSIPSTQPAQFTRDVVMNFFSRNELLSLILATTV
jgi:hypothetical protein